MKLIMKQKYQKKDKYLQKEDKKLFMNQDQYNNMMMEYQKIINLLDNASNQPSIIRTKNWIEINDESRGTYNTRDNVKDIDIVMSMHNLLEYSDNYSKTSGSLQQYCKDIPALTNGNIVELNGANATDSFNFKAKITGQTGNNARIKGDEIMIPLKDLSSSWRTLEMPLINCKINL